MNEIWKDIPEYKEYQVSSLGNIKTLKNSQEKLLQPIKSFDGYLSVGLCNKKVKLFRIHRLVAQAFLLNIENKKEVNHKNGIKSDNRLENLEWCTRGENQKHAIRMGLKKVPTPSKGKFGKDHFNSKEVIQKKEGKQIKIWSSITEAAAFYKIAVSNISAVCKKKSKIAAGFGWEYL